MPLPPHTDYYFRKHIIITSKNNFTMDEYEDYEMFQDDSYEEEYGTHYGKYAGTYAQDVAGYSDDVIDDAFEGDPDAYWNID